MKAQDIIKVLISHGLTRYRIAKKIGVTQPVIDRIYKGIQTDCKASTQEKLELLCREHGIPSK
jgi:predicted transcriptional regulator